MPVYPAKKVLGEPLSRFHRGNTITPREAGSPRCNPAAPPRPRRHFRPRKAPVALRHESIQITE
jgi:hypothetical protein